MVTWGYTILFVIILYAALISYLKLPVPKSEAFYLYNLPRIENFENKIKSGSTGLLLIGDSRLRYAVYEDKILEEKLSQHTGQDIAVLRISNNWATFGDFETLLPDIIKASPSIIVLQEELLAKERAEAAMFLEARTYYIWLLFGTGPWNPGNLNQQDLQQEMRCEALNIEETVEERKNRTFNWIELNPESNNAQKIALFFQNFKSAQTSMKFLRIPITTIGQNGLSTFKSDENIPIYEYPGQIEDRKFCDIVHLNPEGREQYSSWFISRIALEIMEKQI